MRMKWSKNYSIIGHYLVQLLGFIKEDWSYLLKYVKYSGEYKFNTARTLNLKLKK